MLPPHFRASCIPVLLSTMVLFIGFLIGTHTTERVEAAPPSFVEEQATELDDNLVEIVAPDNLRRFICQIQETDEFFDGVGSILIGCSPADGAIAFFAEPTADPQRAARVLSIALTAQALGRQIFIDYFPEDADVVGCSPANCRNIYRIGMY